VIAIDRPVPPSSHPNSNQALIFTFVHISTSNLIYHSVPYEEGGESGFYLSSDTCSASPTLSLWQGNYSGWSTYYICASLLCVLNKKGCYSHQTDRRERDRPIL